MSAQEPDNLAARLLAGELAQEEARQLRERIAADPAARAALGRMEATVAALKAWPASLPASAIPVRKPQRRHWLWVAPVAAAAGLLLAVGLSYRFLGSKDQSMPAGRVAATAARSDWARDEFAFLFARKGSPPPPGSKFGSQPSEGAGKDMKGSDGGPQIGAPGAKGHKAGQALADRARQQLGFAVRIPAELPGSYVLQDAVALSKQSGRLTYVVGASSVVVHLKSSPGADQKTGTLAVPDEPQRRLFVARRSGIGMALEGKAVDQAFFEACLKEFVPVQAKP